METKGDCPRFSICFKSRIKNKNMEIIKNKNMEIIKNKNISKYVGVRFHPDPLK